MLPFYEVRSIIWLLWDPIGLGDSKTVPVDDTEYDSYAREIASVLRKGISLNGLIGYMREASEYMGLSVFDEKRAELAAREIIRRSGMPLED